MGKVGSDSEKSIHKTFSVLLPHCLRCSPSAVITESVPMCCVACLPSWDSWAGGTLAEAIPASASGVAIETTTVPEPASTGSSKLVIEQYLGSWRDAAAPEKVSGSYCAGGTGQRDPLL